MIIVDLPDPSLRGAVVRAARPDEDVVWRQPEVTEARSRGFPRLIVRGSEEEGWDVPTGPPPMDGSVPELLLTRGMWNGWERERRACPVPPSRTDFLAQRLRRLIRERALGPTWVDRLLGDLSRAVGAPLPDPFRGVARRVLEFPSRYADLSALEELTGLSRGALKARFRRRDLQSPTTWIRRFRVLAAAQALSDRSVSTLQAGYRLGMTDSGNLCRLVKDVGGISPTAAREEAGRRRLLLEVAADLASTSARERWRSLGRVFRGAA
ncbi:MAG: AraC family transcriptional regulator [Gemmatimonadota bacterium]|jgi:AraC-like DNA-binding protein